MSESVILATAEPVQEAAPSVVFDAPAAIPVSHLAASTRPEALFTVSFMNDWTNEHVAGHEPRSQAGFGSAPTRPGLGIDVDVAALGTPLFSVSA